MWHVSSRSGVATLRTAILLLLTYYYTRLTILFHDNLGKPVAYLFCSLAVLDPRAGQNHGRTFSIYLYPLSF